MFLLWPSCVSAQLGSLRCAGRGLGIEGKGESARPGKDLGPLMFAMRTQEGPRQSALNVLYPRGAKRSAKVPARRQRDVGPFALAMREPEGPDALRHRFARAPEAHPLPQ